MGEGDVMQCCIRSFALVGAFSKVLCGRFFQGNHLQTYQQMWKEIEHVENCNSANATAD